MGTGRGAVGVLWGAGTPAQISHTAGEANDGDNKSTELEFTQCFHLYGSSSTSGTSWVNSATEVNLMENGCIWWKMASQNNCFVV